MPSKKPNLKKATYSATEIGTLIEELRSEFRTVIDIATDVKAEVAGMKSWRVGVDEKLIKLDFIILELKDLKTDLKTFDHRLIAVEATVGV